MGEGELERLAEEYIQYAQTVLEKGHESPQVAAEALHILHMGRDGVVEALKYLAYRYGGCVSCRYSTPAWPASLSLTARFCRLGLRQEDCGRWGPLVI